MNYGDEAKVHVQNHCRNGCGVIAPHLRSVCRVVHYEEREEDDCAYEVCHERNEHPHDEIVELLIVYELMDGLDKVEIVKLVVQQSVILLDLVNHSEVVDYLVVPIKTILIE